ncbi:MAG: WYL domain-containing protein [Eubacteriales bacterium]
MAVSPPFIGWLVGFGNQVTVVEPSSLAETVRKTLTEILKAYEIS